jgi:hypothetical protein
MVDYHTFVVSGCRASPDAGNLGFVDSFVVVCDGIAVAQGARSRNFDQILVETSLDAFRMDLVSSHWLETFTGQPAAVWRLTDSGMLDVSIEEFGFAWGIFCKRRVMRVGDKQFLLYRRHDRKVSAPDINLNITLNQPAGTLKGLLAQTHEVNFVASLFAIAFFWFDTRPE